MFFCVCALPFGGAQSLFITSPVPSSPPLSSFVSLSVFALWLGGASAGGGSAHSLFIHQLPLQNGCELIFDSSDLKPTVAKKSEDGKDEEVKQPEEEQSESEGVGQHLRFFFLSYSTLLCGCSCSSHFVDPSFLFLASHQVEFFLTLAALVILSRLFSFFAYLLVLSILFPIFLLFVYV